MFIGRSIVLLSPHNKQQTLWSLTRFMYRFWQYGNEQLSCVIEQLA
jgi:hypothetical protein